MVPLTKTFVSKTKWPTKVSKIPTQKGPMVFEATNTKCQPRQLDCKDTLGHACLAGSMHIALCTLHWAKCTYCNVCTLQSSHAVKCTGFKVNWLQSALVEKCACCKVYMLKSAKNKLSSNPHYILHFTRCILYVAICTLHLTLHKYPKI